MRSVQALITISYALGILASPVQADTHVNKRSPWSRRHNGRSNEHYARQENEEFAVGPPTSIVDTSTLSQTAVEPAFPDLLASATATLGDVINSATSALSEALSSATEIPEEVISSLSSAASEIISSASEILDPSSPPVLPSSTPVVPSSEPPVAPSSEPPVVPSSEPPVVPSSEPPVVPSSSEPPAVPSSEPPVIPSSTSSIIVIIPSSSEEPVIPSSTPEPVPSSSEPPTPPPSSTEPPIPPPSSTSEPPLLSSILSDISSFFSSVLDPITDPPISSSTPEPQPPSSSEPPTPPPSSSEPPAPPPSSSEEPPISSSSTPNPPPVSSSTSSSSSAFNPSDLFPDSSSSVAPPSITITSSTSLRPVSLDSAQEQLLTRFTFSADDVTSTSLSITITDPDAPLSATSSVSVVDDPRTLSPNAPRLSSEKPSELTPSDAVEECPADTTDISLLFNEGLNWAFVIGEDDQETQGLVAQAILAYIPKVVGRCLGQEEAIGTKGLKAFIPKGVTTNNGIVEDLSKVSTIYAGCCPTDGISSLEAYIRDSRSCFYNSGNSEADKIASHVVKSYNLVQNKLGDSETVANEVNSQNGTDNSRRNAIIGVCVAFGTIALGVFIWWLHKTRQQRREGSHRRLSYQNAPNYGTHINALGPQGGAPLMAQTPGTGQRRNSFYAFGPDAESFEDDTFDYMSQNSQANYGGAGGVQRGPSYTRRPVVGQPISQPILRETSMGNW